jgi:serine/threonine-protein kinase PRP4
MRQKSEAIGFTGASGHDWDDEEGYYIPNVGEVMDGRYLVVEIGSGRGVFSNVVKAKDQKASADQGEQGQQGSSGLVAIKILRANDMMTKQAEKEIEILQRLNSADKKDKRHVIRLLETFAYRKHLCLVFECMGDDLRAALKKYTKNKGMTMPAVRAYTQQLLIGLSHMHKCKIVHADIKPDNILIGKGHQIVKFCDLGTAVELKDIGTNPYLASRNYRAPEVILGCDYTQAVDTWALGCSLYELFTGKTLLTSKSNNDHLKKTMELKGKIPGKVIKKGAVWKNHFTEELDFKWQDEDPNSGQQIIRTITELNAKRSIKDAVLERVDPEKKKSTAPEDKEYVRRATQFSDLIEQMLTLDPEKRIKPDDALNHPFLQNGPVGKAAAGEAARAGGRGK